MQEIEEDSFYDEEERANFIKVLSSFQFYKKNSFARIDQRLCYINSLPERQQFMLENYKCSLETMKKLVNGNNRIIEKMLANVNHMFENSKSEIVPNELVHSFDPDSDKVHITLKQIVRDWTDLGSSEREQCYKPIIDELSRIFDLKNMTTNEKRVLVPGAALGRLVYEISMRGFYCEGNEFSLFMLIASNFVLNQTLVDEQYEIFPFAHQFVNNLYRSDPLQSCRFPDISPHQNPPIGEINMIAGDFVQVYGAVSQKGLWDAVCTCFFIDCANNIVDFCEIIHRILRPGGVWINLGPLLYHFCDVPNEFSIEPSYEDLRSIIETVGFKFLKEDTKVKTKYSQNSSNMAQLEYNSVFFVVMKEELIKNEQDSLKTEKNEIH